MKYKELLNMTEAEAKAKLAELKAQSSEMATKLRLNQLKNVKELGKIKKDIARLMTFLHNK